MTSVNRNLIAMICTKSVLILVKQKDGSLFTGSHAFNL